MIHRRELLKALGFAACAPAIVRVSSIMPVRAYYETRVGDVQLLELFVATREDGTVTINEILRIDGALITPAMVPIHAETSCLGKTVTIAQTNEFSPDGGRAKLREVLEDFGLWINPPAPGGVMRYWPPPGTELSTIRMARVQV